MAGMFLFLGGCQKDQVSGDAGVKTSEDKHVMPYQSMKYLSLDEVPDIKRHIIREITKLNARNGNWNVSNINFNHAQHIKIDHQNETYAVEITHDIPNRVFNLIIQKKDGVLSLPFIMGYNMDPAFLAGYKTGMYNMLQYRGSITQYPMSVFFASGGRTQLDCEEIGSCMRVYVNYLNNKGVGSSTTGGTGLGFGGFGDGNPFGDFGDFGDFGNSTEGNSSTTSSGAGQSGTNNDTGNDGGGTSPCPPGSIEVEIPLGYGLILVVCLRKKDPGYAFHSGSGQRDDSVDDCIELLKVLGYVDSKGSVAEDPTADCIQQCREEHPEVVKAIEDLKNKQIIHPCTGQKFNFDTDKIEDELCFTGNYNINALNNLVEKELDGVDYVNLDEIPIQKSDCSKSDADNIAGFNKFMQENGGCSKEGFQNALNSFLGFGSTISQNNPPLTANNKLCPNSIIVTPSTWDPTRQNVAGISALQITLNNGVSLSFQNLFFKVDHTRDCGISTEQLIADAINNSMQIANDNIAQGNPIYNNGINNNNIQFTRLVEEQMKKIANKLGCKPKFDPNNNQTTNTPAFSAQAIPSSYGNATIGSEHCGARFVHYSTMQTGC